MTNLTELTTSQLHRILAIKEQIETLKSQIDFIAGGGLGGEIPIPSAAEAPVPAKRKLTAAHRRKLVKALAKARKIRWAEIKGEAATDSKPAKKKDRCSSPAGNSGREAEVRETGRGLVEHLDEIGRQQGQAQLIQYLMNFRIHYTDDSRGRGGGRGLRVKMRDPFPADTMPDWLKLAREQFPDLGEAIYGFADRHRDRVLRRHERKADINGLSNFIDVMVATSKMLFVYLRRGVLTQPQVIARMRDYLNIFTGTIPQYRDEEATGYLARIYSNGNGNPGQLKKTLGEHNVSGHLRALLRVAQVVRGSADGSDASTAGSQLPMLVDQVNAFENRIGLGKATAVQIGRALEDYEMLTKQERALWTKVWSEAGSESNRLLNVGRGEKRDNNPHAAQKEGSAPQSGGQGQAGSGGQSEMGEGEGGGEEDVAGCSEGRKHNELNTNA